MKLVTFEVRSYKGFVQRVGAVVGKEIVDLQLAYSAYLAETQGIAKPLRVAAAIIPDDMLGFIENGSVARGATEQALQYIRETGYPREKDGQRMVYEGDEVRLRAPLPRPTAIRDTASFELHVKNAFKKLNLGVPDLWYEIPVHYRSTHTNVAGPEDPILWPSFTEKLDYELGFACCIGKQGKNIPQERAADYIFGYTIYNDISARDIQSKEVTLGAGAAKGKNFENANIIGPCLVTADAIDPNNLRMVARVNGEVWSEGNSRDMYYKFPDLIAYLSKDEPIYPGEIIGSGTVGFGCGLELDKWIQPGDVVEMEVEGIGVLRNRVERRGY